MANKGKTHSGSKKRFKITASGKIKRSRAYTSHNSKNKTHKQIVGLRKAALVSDAQAKTVKKMINK